MERAAANVTDLIAEVEEDAAARRAVIEKVEWFKLGACTGFRGVLGGRPRCIIAADASRRGGSDLVGLAVAMDRGEA